MRLKNILPALCMALSLPVGAQEYMEYGMYSDNTAAYIPVSDIDSITYGDHPELEDNVVGVLARNPKASIFYAALVETGMADSLRTNLFDYGFKHTVAPGWLYWHFYGTPYTERENRQNKFTVFAETDEAYLACVLGQAINKEVVTSVSDKLKIVYTPFHGAGYKLVPEALKRLGVTRLYPVPEQMVLDGNFPTVASPNPENPEGFYLAVALAKKVGSDLIIGTDPDSDRIGVMVRDGEDYTPITGNQLGVLLLDYIINARREAGTLPENAGAVKSIVTTEMAKVVAETNGVHFEDTFTGFKFMAERVAEWEKTGTYKYIFAYEESYGYMMGDYVRDKDAVTASMMVAEMAAHYLAKGMNLKQAMESLYEKYGYYEERTLNLLMPGLDGIEKMKNLMADLRNDPPKFISGTEVFCIRDYSTGDLIVPKLGVMGQTDIKGSNVLYFELADETAFIVRPSGTEPKVKVYILAKGENRAECDEKVAKYVEYAETLRR